MLATYDYLQHKKQSYVFEGLIAIKEESREELFWIKISFKLIIT